jgi:hypothetical protein
MKALAILLLFTTTCFAQVAMPFKEAREKGIYPQVDSIYKSAFHSTEPEKAVFKTEEAVQKHIAAYQDFLLKFGEFLNDNNFKWEESTRCFNRIYMAEDGTIDYFLYDFKTPLSEDKANEFHRLLNLYISQHKFGITAPEKFAQCSPAIYPKSE